MTDSIHDPPMVYYLRYQATIRGILGYYGDNPTVGKLKKNPNTKQWVTDNFWALDNRIAKIWEQYGEME